MTCPSCGAQIKDEDAVFCPRCGRSLAGEEADATAEIGVEQTETIATSPVKEPPTEPEGTDPGTAPDVATDAQPVTESPPEVVSEPEVRTPRSEHSGVVGDLFRAMPRTLRRQGWPDLIAAAGFGVLAMLAAAAVLVAAARLQYPFLGEGASPVRVITAIGLAAVGMLGAPLSIGEVQVSAIPLGAMVFVGWATVWATARAVRKGPSVRLIDAVKDGMKVAVPFALLCWIAALVFRIQEDPTPVSAGGGSALVFGAAWGALFGALGGYVAVKPLRRHATDALASMRERQRSLYEGVSSAGLMLIVTLCLGAAAALLWVIVGLIQGRPRGGLGLAEGAAAVLYLAAFAPNVLAAIVAVAHGAPVEVGAQVTAGGKLVGPLTELSLFSWGESGPPWYVYLLLVIPVFAALIGGFAARRSARNPGDVVQVLGIMAAIYSIALFLLSVFSEARLGAGLIRARGFGRVAPDAGIVLLLAFAWAIVGGFLGWRVADAQRGAGSPKKEGE